MPRRIEPWDGDGDGARDPPGQPATLLERRPDLLRRGAARSRQLAPPAGRGRMVPAPVLERAVRQPGRRAQWRRPRARALRQRRRPAGHAALQRGPHAGASTTVAESGQNEAVLRYEDAIVRALEDVENALVALATNASARNRCSAAASADAALGRAQSLYDRGQIDLLPLLDAQRAQLAVRVSANDSRPSCCSTACACSRRWAAAGRRSSLRQAPRPPATGVARRRIPATRRHPRGSVVKTTLATAVTLAVAALLGACSPDAARRGAAADPLRRGPLRRRPRRQPLLRRRAGAPRGRPGLPRRRQGRAAPGRRRPGVREGDVLAVLDDTDYRLAEDAARQLEAAVALARQAESDWERMRALKGDGSVSDSDEEHAKSDAQTAHAAAKAEGAHSSNSRATGSSTRCCALRAAAWSPNVRFEVGQVVAAGQPVVADRRRGRAGDRRGRARGPPRPRSSRRRSGPRSRARRTRPSTSRCASCRRRRRRRRARTARA